MTNTALNLRLLSHVKPYWRVFLFSILGMTVVAATEPALPALTKPLIEGTFIKKDPVVMCWFLMVIVALFVAIDEAQKRPHYIVLHATFDGPREAD